MKRLRYILMDAWVERRVMRSLKAGRYNDPITERRRLARAARGPEDAS